MKRLFLSLCAFSLLAQTPAFSAGLSKSGKPFYYKNHGGHNLHPANKHVAAHKVPHHPNTHAAEMKRHKH